MSVMPVFTNAGDGSDGDLIISSGTTTETPVAQCPITITSGTATATVATGLAFAAGQRVYIHQSRGSGVGTRERNEVLSYNSGTGALVLRRNVSNSYNSSGSDCAQIKTEKQYRSVTISAGAIWTAPSWSDSVGYGGLLTALVQGDINNSGQIKTDQLGFTGGLDGEYALSQWGGASAEGSAGASSGRRAVSGNVCTAANGNGGAGGGGQSGGSSGTGGGGGSNQSAGVAAGSAVAGLTGIYASDFSLMGFGGGGGGGGSAPGNGASTHGGVGGTGGGMADVVYGGRLHGSGSITSAGGNGSNAANIGTDESGGGAGGAGGSNSFRGPTADFSEGLTMTALHGNGGLGSNGGAENGGNGGDGWNYIECCTLTPPSADSNPIAQKQIGGVLYCSVQGSMF